MSSIDILPWDESFQTGVSLIDEQHQKLVEIINSLATQFVLKPHSVNTDTVFNQLIDYTHYHFQSEEKIWNDYLDKESIDTHHSTHTSFIKQLQKIIHTNNVTSKQTPAEQTLNLLVQWLVSHILESDRLLAYRVLALQNGHSLDDSHAIAQEQMSGYAREVIDIVTRVYKSLSSTTFHLIQEIQKKNSTEIVLNKQHIFLKSLINTIPDLIWLKDPEGIYISCNKKFESFFGATESEIIGKTDYDFVDKELADFFRTHDKTVMKSGKSNTNEEWVTFAADEHKELLETTKSPMYTADGNLIGVLGIGHEITKQREKEDRLNYALIGPNDGFWDWNLETNSLYLSPRWLEMVGYKVGELPANVQSWQSLLHPNDLEHTLQTVQKYVEGTLASYETEFRMLHKNGYWVHILSRGKFVTDKDGDNAKPLRMVGTHVDITDRWIQQEEIKRINTQLQSILDNIPDIIFRSKRNDSWTITYTNNAIEKITGYPASDFIMDHLRSFFSIVHAADKKMVAKVKNTLREGESYQVDYRIINSIGDTLWIHESGSVLVDQHKNQIIEGILTDITLEKQMHIKMQKFMDLQSNIVVLTDAKRLKFTNQRFLDFFGYDSLNSFLEEHKCISECFVEHANFFTPKQVKRDEIHWIESLLRLSGRKRIVSIVNKHNEPHAFTVSINDYEPNTYIVNFTDITDSFAEKLELQNQAHFDQLTQIYNRNYFDQNIDKIIAKHTQNKQMTALIMLDIDFFKKVNDTYGHDIGDSVLVELSSYMLSLIRKEDTFIRWGGEEFIVVFPVGSQDVILSFSNYIREAIEDKSFAHVDTLTCSFGATVYKNGEDISECIKRADTALYKAKNSGRNRVAILY